MKKSIKYVVVLCMLVVMLMPTTAFAAEKPCLENLGQVGLKVNATMIQDLCSKYMPNLKNGLDLQALKDAYGKLGSVQSGKNCDFTKVPAAAQAQKNSAPKAAAKSKEPVAAEKPAAPVTQKKPAAPATSEKPAAPAATQKPAAPAENNAAAGSYEMQVVDLLNKERAVQGLPALKYNAELSKVAEAKAADLRDKNYFSHTSPTYGSPFDMMKAFGIKYTAAGENIAKGYMNPESVMKGWMNSPGHKANILNSSFTEIGVGYVSGSNGTGYWVQMFIRP
jgi:uncharacterized YkwD family protein